MRPHLELLAALLVDVRAPQHRVALDPSRHRNGAANTGVGSLGVVNDFLRRRVQCPVVVGLHPDSNSSLIAVHNLSRDFRSIPKFGATRSPLKSGGERIVKKL